MEVATVGSFSSPLCLRVSFHALQPLSVSTWAHTIVYSHAITSTVSHTALLLTSTAPGGRHTQSFAQILPEGCWGPGGRGGVLLLGWWSNSVGEWVVHTAALCVQVVGVGRHACSEIGCLCLELLMGMYL